MMKFEDSLQIFVRGPDCNLERMFSFSRI